MYVIALHGIKELVRIRHRRELKMKWAVGYFFGIEFSVFMENIKHNNYDGCGIFCKTDYFVLFKWKKNYECWDHYFYVWCVFVWILSFLKFLEFENLPFLLEPKSKLYKMLEMNHSFSNTWKEWPKRSG